MGHSRRAVLAALAGGAVVGAGCSASPNGEPSAHATAGSTTATTVAPDERFSGPSVELPPGPRDAPDRPAPLTAEATREYVARFEEAYLYNEYHRDDTLRMSVTATVPELFVLEPGFAARVSGRGSMEFGDPQETTVHGDFGTGGSVTYLVDADTTLRKRASPCEHVPAEIAECAESG
jgi:hypothetical protein